MVKKRGSNKNRTHIKKKIHFKYYIFLRYLILLAIALFLPLIYTIFTPLTIFPSLWLLDLFYKVSLNNNLITIENLTKIEIIPACIAGSAYLLLFILIFSVPINNKKRILAIISSFGILLSLNIIRIVILSIWFHEGFIFFDFTHKLFWYVLSTLFVIAIWFFIVKLISIKEIPIYTDLKSIMK